MTPQRRIFSPAKPRPFKEIFMQPNPAQYTLTTARAGSPQRRKCSGFEALQFANLLRLPDFAAPSRIFITALLVLGPRQHRRHLELAPMAVYGHESQISATDVA